MSRESSSGRYIGNPLFEANPPPHSQALSPGSAATCTNQVTNPGAPGGNYYQHRSAQADAR